MIVNASRLAFAKQDIRRLFQSYGKRDYIGEEGVSQVSHAFQTVAHTCRLLQLIPDYKQDALSIRHIIVAGWLHDIGQLKSFEEHDTTRSKWGVHKHEQIGSQYLQTLGFPYPVFRLTKYHVKAKRYMVTTNAKYRENLSVASLATNRVENCLTKKFVISNPTSYFTLHFYYDWQMIRPNCQAM